MGRKKAKKGMYKCLKVGGCKKKKMGRNWMGHEGGVKQGKKEIRDCVIRRSHQSLRPMTLKEISASGCHPGLRWGP